MYRSSSRVRGAAHSERELWGARTTTASFDIGGFVTPRYMGWGVGGGAQAYAPTCRGVVAAVAVVLVCSRVRITTKM